MENKNQRYYTPNEVRIHNHIDDIWVSYLGKVYNLTPLCKEHKGDTLLNPILQSAGEDISHWFNPKTKDIKGHVDPLTSCIVPYTPQGRVGFIFAKKNLPNVEMQPVGFSSKHGDVVMAQASYIFIHIPPNQPSSEWANDFGRPWFKDDKYCIGSLSTKTRMVRVINTLTSQEQTLEVCSEEKLEEILSRYLKYNCHAGSYTWKYECVNLDMDKTLEENGVRDDDEDFYKLRIDDDIFLQALHLYFNDDLTES